MKELCDWLVDVIGLNFTITANSFNLHNPLYVRAI